MAFCTQCGTKLNGRYCPSCGYDSEETGASPDQKIATTNDVSKKDTLQKLYALRAGVSYVSTEKDKYERAKNTYKNRLLRIEKDIASDEIIIEKTRADLELSKRYAGKYTKEEMDRGYSSSLDGGADDKVSSLKKRLISLNSTKKFFAIKEKRTMRYPRSRGYA